MNGVKIIFAITALLYAVVLPPFQVRDEAAHFAKAAQLATMAFPQTFQDNQPHRLDIAAQYQQNRAIQSVLSPRSGANC